MTHTWKNTLVNYLFGAFILFMIAFVFASLYIHEHGMSVCG